MFCATTHYRTTPEHLDDAVDVFKRKAVTFASHQPGFHSLCLLTKHDGTIMTVTLWDTEEQAAAWPQCPEHRKIVRLLRPLLTGRPTRNGYDVRIHALA
jgi:heme-degrading monooxygenase HmoA